MSIFEDINIRKRLREAFPRYFVNHNYEIIICPARNSYFLIADVNNEIELKAKILERLSREASKSITKQSRSYHTYGINTFLGTSFTAADMDMIYSKLGNRVNHAKTLRFIESGYDMAVLNPIACRLGDKPEKGTE